MEKHCVNRGEIGAGLWGSTPHSSASRFRVARTLRLVVPTSEMANVYDNQTYAGDTRVATVIDNEETRECQDPSPIFYFHTDHLQSTEFVTDSKICEEFHITKMTLWRWDRNPAIGFPPPVYINARKFRSRRQIEQFKENLVRRAIAARPGSSSARGRPARAMRRRRG